MKKLRLIGLLPFMCLSACSKSSIAGLYEFRLGKTDGAHIGISVELKDDAYEKREGMKQMFLSADLGSEYSIEAFAEQYEEEYPFVADIVSKVLKALPEDKRIDAYYQVTDIKNPKYGNRVKVGSDFIEEVITEAFPEFVSIIEGFIQLIFPEKTISSLTEPDMVQLIACAYGDGKNFTFQIPVSSEDLFQQLAWYGYLIDQNSYSIFRKLDPNKLPGIKGEERFGNHPTSVKDEQGNIVSSEVDAMNEAFEYDFSRTYLYEVDEYGVETAIGSFIAKANESDRKGLYFSPFDSSSTITSFSGRVKLNVGTLSEKKIDVNFGVSPNAKEVTVEPNGKTGNDEGFFFHTSGEDVEVRFKDFIVEPFEFRDFHDVKVGLSKV